MLFITLGMRADDYKEVGHLGYLCNSDNKTATLVTASVNDVPKLTEGTDLIIPETIDVDGTVYTVTALNANCLSTSAGCPLLSSITLPSTVKTIGENAFKGQSKLTSVNFPDVETITGGAFSGCTSLKEATLGIYSTVIGQDNKFIFDNDVPLDKLTLSRAETDKSSNDKDDVSGIIFPSLTNLNVLHLPALTTLKWRGYF
ncbi:MAG: leucine-rich repeat domain-containing protein, partial [Prevotella sp.]|nr:leucine-rich repeat domain-containing protein [Prevotella sp.]